MAETEVVWKSVDYLPGLREIGGVQGIQLRLINFAMNSPNLVIYAIIIASAIWILKGQLIK